MKERQPGAERKMQRVKEGPSNEEIGCWWVVGGGLQKSGARRRKRGKRQIEADRLVEVVCNEILCSGRTEHSATNGLVLSLLPDSRGHASPWDLASQRTLGKPAKCRFRFFSRLPAKLSILPDKLSSVHNCKFHCSDP